MQEELGRSSQAGMRCALSTRAMRRCSRRRAETNRVVDRAMGSASRVRLRVGRDRRHAMSLGWIRQEVKGER